MTHVVITADDFGLSPSVSAGIAEAHRRGLVSNTTWMANLPESAEAAAELRTMPDLDRGIHLNLTAGAPLLPASAVPTLIDGRVRFRPLAELLGRAAAGRVRADEVRREWAEQIEAGLAAGLTFSSLTGHQHVHMHPLWFGIAAELAATYRIPVIRRSRFRPLRSTLRSPSFMALELCSALIRGRGGIHSPTYLMTAREFVRGVGSRHVPHGRLVEVIAHPGYVDERLRVRDPLHEPRLEDLSLLTDSAVRSAVERTGIRITTFRALHGRSPGGSPPTDPAGERRT